MAAAEPNAETLADALAAAFGDHPPKRVGVAVSGGSDSLAALVLCRDYAKQHAIDVMAVTVDHGLRAEAAAEAQAVAHLCADLGLSHHVLKWSGWSGAGNLQNEARTARYDLMAGWAARNGITDIVLGHTQDDQAETVLMRLARGAGVDGLAAMQPERRLQGVRWLRPLLGCRRESLRDMLTARGITWCEDPSNQNPQFDRIKARGVLQAVAPAGVDVPHLAQVAQNMASAQIALDWVTARVARDVVEIKAGAVAFDWRGVQDIPSEITRRLLIGAIKWISGAAYAPRRVSLAETIERVEGSGSATLGGCQFLLKSDQLWVFREYKLLQGQAEPPNALLDGRWDGRWTIRGPAERLKDARVAALGDAGLALCPDWREYAIPREVLRGLPSVWADEQLLAAPILKIAPEWHFDQPGGDEGFFAALLSH